MGENDDHDLISDVGFSSDSTGGRVVRVQHTLIMYKILYNIAR